MKQNNTEQKPLQDGMNVFHKTLRQILIVRNDEKGPAYVGKDFADNEISLSYAIAEMEAGNLEIVSSNYDQLKAENERLCNKMAFIENDVIFYKQDIEKFKAENQKKEDTIKELLHCINQFIIWAKSDTAQMVNVIKKAIELYTKHKQ